MVDAKKVLSVTAGFVGAAGLATLATGANTVSASTGTVNYKSGATTVWNSPSWHQVKRYVTFGDKVQVLGQKVDRNGATWYKVGDNQWIPGIYLNFDGKTVTVQAPEQTASQAPVSQAPASQAPASQAPASQAAAQPDTQTANIQLYVKNIGSAVTVWATPAYSQATGQYLEGNQTLTAVAQLQANGETWYRLANGGYVPERFASTTPAPAPQSSAATSVAAPTAPVSDATASNAAASNAAASDAAVSSAAAVQTTTPESSAAPATTQVDATQEQQQQAEPSNTVNAEETTNNATPAPTPAPAPVTPSRQAKIQAVISIAEQQIGKPYVWGGKGPNSFDCSGLMYYAFLNGAGVNIGGWTVPQESSGQQVSLSALQPGDLLFWGGRGSSYHVALYIGGGTMIQAPQPGENVKYTALAYFMPDFAVRPSL
ncbi:Peptidoglycan endopeptidase RipA precursor [Lacticaseibacillus paracasei]|uniref:cell wall hydrolase P75 n=1 Tax=Lacticaseibacillus paracasei TaxID=1597 RepID=UPI000F0AFA46|nr:cell wall hydrolase P75 [Lacticaseibacillus paracasei]RND41416.1 Peptidoglycan endopeptidase RipA precursor [Lacticaseibacillus paracasei]RNE47741.1 Peptidoglycan endopeptidase RipA precursor [Lacticaseibacillus paracasei]